MAFFAFFTLISATLLWFVGLRPALAYLDSEDWREVPCIVEVVRSRQVRSSGDRRATTKTVLDVLYRYDVGGRTYRSNHYGFLAGSATPVDERQRLHEGAEATCWVDPEDPVLAVLEREPSVARLWMLLPGAFVVIGVTGMAWAFRRTRRASSSR